MKINIENAYPIIERDQRTPRHIHYYLVIGWEVQGTYMVDGYSKNFDLNLRIEQQAVTENELVEMIKKRLNEK